MDLYYFEILNFVFSSIKPRGVSSCKILTLLDEYFQKKKSQKIVKFSFLDFLADFLKKFALKTCGILKMLLLSGQNKFFIKFICRRAFERKIQV